MSLKRLVGKENGLIEILLLIVFQHGSADKAIIGGGEQKSKSQKGVKEMNINISQIDSRILVEIDGKALPDIFSGYTLKSCGCGEPELQLSLKGNISISELSVKIKE